MQQTPHPYVNGTKGYAFRGTTQIRYALRRKASRSFFAFNGAIRRGLTGAHGRTKRYDSRGAFSLWQPLSGAIMIRYIPGHSFNARSLS